MNNSCDTERSILIRHCEERRAASPRDDALSALLNLGYARDTSQRAVDGALAETESTATLETVLRSALRRLVGLP